MRAPLINRAIDVISESRPLNSSILADILGVKMETGFKIAARLVEAGAVEWFTEIDGRYTTLELTDEAHRARRMLGYDNADLAAGAFPGGSNG